MTSLVRPRRSIREWHRERSSRARADRRIGAAICTKTHQGINGNLHARSEPVQTAPNHDSLTSNGSKMKKRFTEAQIVGFIGGNRMVR
jgi:hypothetical protein